MPYNCLHFCAANNLSAGRSTTQALSLITVAHWAQSGKLSVQHIKGEVSNVFEHTNQDDLLLSIINTFSFQGNTVLNMTGDATNGKSCFLYRLALHVQICTPCTDWHCMCKFALLVQIGTACANLHFLYRFEIACANLHFLHRLALHVQICTSCTDWHMHVQICTPCADWHCMCKFVLLVQNIALFDCAYNYCSNTRCCSFSL